MLPLAIVNPRLLDAAVPLERDEVELLAVVQEGYRDGLTIAIRKPDQEKES